MTITLGSIVVMALAVAVVVIGILVRKNSKRLHELNAMVSEK